MLSNLCACVPRICSGCMAWLSLASAQLCKPSIKPLNWANGICCASCTNAAGVASLAGTYRCKKFQLSESCRTANVGGNFDLGARTWFYQLDFGSFRPGLYCTLDVTVGYHKHFCCHCWSFAVASWPFCNGFMRGTDYPPFRLDLCLPQPV